MTNPASQQPAPIPKDLKEAYENGVIGSKNYGDSVTGAEYRMRMRHIERIARLEAALRVAEEGLHTSYNVQDYPGDGTSTQDEALRTVRAALSTPLRTPGRDKP